MAELKLIDNPKVKSKTINYDNGFTTENEFMFNKHEYTALLLLVNKVDKADFLKLSHDLFMASRQ